MLHAACLDILDENNERKYPFAHGIDITGSSELPEEIKKQVESGLIK